MIKIKDLYRSFSAGKTNALKNINLEIKEGEFIALIGASGSGKSTLLNLIGGLDYPTKGKVIINKKDISEYNDNQASQYRSQKIGFIFQEFHLESFLNVKQNVLLPTYFSQYSKKEEEYAEKLIKEVELTNKIKSKISELSGGQKQRTAIARALINKPKIILADEPTGNLDTKTGKTIINLLTRLHKKHNTTLIIATHDKEIAKSASRIIQISDGQIIK